MKDLLQDVVESKQFPGYLVAPDGRIFSTQRYGPHCPASTPYKGRLTRELKRSISRNKKYIEVGLVKDGKEYRMRVHRLVAECYLPPKPFKEAVVRHLEITGTGTSHGEVDKTTQTTECCLERLQRVAETEAQS